MTRSLATLRATVRRHGALARRYKFMLRDERRAARYAQLARVALLALELEIDRLVDEQRPQSAQ